MTMCPDCEICFNVSQSQLAAAAGAVRCGACLLVFQADEHLKPHVNHQALAQAVKPQVDADCTRDLFTDSLQNGGASDSNKPNLEAPIYAQEDPMARNDPMAEAWSPIEGFDGSQDVHNKEDIIGPIITSQTRSNFLWPVLSVLLLVSMALQYLWFNRLPLAQDADWRAHYLLVCQYVDCELTEFDDITQLSAVDLLVRSHPDLSTALRVEAALKNTADYPQKYPRLRLNFMDKSGGPVAARTFNAADYLGGELRGVRMIPANTKVRLSLEVVDPSPNAVDYSIQVAP